MGFEVYRVNRRFVWDGWQFAPKAGSHGQTFDVLTEPRGSGQAAKGARASYPRDAADWMKSQGCWDERSCNPEFYGGDLWIVEENHPRKAAILARNKAVYYNGQESIPELLEDDKYKRLLAPPASMARV